MSNVEMDKLEEQICVDPSSYKNWTEEQRNLYKAHRLSSFEAHIIADGADLGSVDPFPKVVMDALALYHAKLFALITSDETTDEAIDECVTEMLDALWIAYKHFGHMSEEMFVEAFDHFFYACTPGFSSSSRNKYFEQMAHVHPEMNNF
jgi:hypothetical protein